MPKISFVNSKKLVKSEFKKETDINTIMERYTRTGQLPIVSKKIASYGDFSNVPDYQTSLNIVNAAQAQFDALPSHLRKFFNHDPSRMLEFVANPENKQHMIKLGLATEKQNASVTGQTESSGEGQSSNSTSTSNTKDVLPKS